MYTAAAADTAICTVTTMTDPAAISRHYSPGELLADIERGVITLCGSTDQVTTEQLARVDEFHIGGRQASMDFLDQLDINASHQVLDIGCGLGGAARFVAERYGAVVEGVDLTAEFVDTGNVLCKWTGLDGQITLRCGDATDCGLPSASIDRAYLLHVGMNIPDKAALFAEVYRLLRPGGLFGVYDVMGSDGDGFAFPVPWAAEAAHSAVASPESYRQALASAGFERVTERDRREFALAFFAQLKQATDTGAGPPPLGLHLTMGRDALAKMDNMISNIQAGRISPVEMIARKPA